MIVETPDGKVVDFGDLSPDSVKSIMLKKYPPTAPASPTAPKPGGGRLAELYPSIGGMAGGFGGAALGAMTGPFAPVAIPAFALAGSSVLGGVGEAAKLEERGEPVTFGRMADEGSRQALYQGVGMGSGMLASAAAGPIARGLGPTATKVARVVGKGMKFGLPGIGAASHGVEGAAVGFVLNAATKKAAQIASSPAVRNKAAALLASPQFQLLVGQDARAAQQLYQQMVHQEPVE